MKRTIINFLVERFSPIFITLFGSTVNGRANSQSDVDIAFFNKGENINKYDLFMAAQDLATLLNQDVDLVDLKNASTVFQAQILQTGKIIYCMDDHKKDMYEMKVLKMYVKLNEERLPILNSIEESGSIYEK